MVNYSPFLHACEYLKSNVTTLLHSMEWWVGILHFFKSYLITISWHCHLFASDLSHAIISSPSPSSSWLVALITLVILPNVYRMQSCQQLLGRGADEGRGRSLRGLQDCHYQNQEASLRILWSHHLCQHNRSLWWVLTFRVNKTWRDKISVWKIN